MSILFLDNSGSSPVTPRLPIIAIIGTATRHGQRKSPARGKKNSSWFTVNTWGTRGCRGGRELAGFHRTALAGATLHELTQISSDGRTSFDHREIARCPSRSHSTIQGWAAPYTCDRRSSDQGRHHTENTG